MFLKSVRINNSSFFAETEINFSSQLNCIMGGRGSGKTTVVSLINWALFDEEKISKELLSLIKSNLGGGVLELVFESADGSRFNITKAVGTPPIAKDNSGEIININEFRKHHKIEYFPSGMIEKIGLDPKERLRIFDTFVGLEIETLKNNISILISKLKENELHIKNLSSNLNQSSEELVSYKELDGELLKIKDELSKVETDENVKAAFDAQNLKQTKRSQEKQFCTKVEEHIEKAKFSSKSLKDALRIVLANYQNDFGFDSQVAMQIQTLIHTSFARISGDVDNIESELNDLDVKVHKLRSDLNENHARDEVSFTELKQKQDKNRDLYHRENLLIQRKHARDVLQEKIEQSRKQLVDFENERTGLLNNLEDHLKKRLDLRKRKALEINSSLGSGVKVLISGASLNENFEELLKSTLLQNKMRFTVSEQKILDSVTPSELASFIRLNDVNGFCERFEIDNPMRVHDIFRLFLNTGLVFDLDTCICEDSPNFFLEVSGEGEMPNYKPTEELSTGQRCTAVLPILFKVTSHPLIIDQPEDNLDNKYIVSSIHKIIRETKTLRQLIFVTHNPNIPVIAASEFNVFLTFQNAQSEITAFGSVEDVKNSIIELLEGGERAFRLRKEFYDI